MVTHDRRQMELLADRIAFLRKGKVVFSKPAKNYDFDNLGEGIRGRVEEIV
jgi:ABC-type multidrug transport system ATPase subunit